MRRDLQPITRADWKAAYERMKRAYEAEKEENETLRKVIAVVVPKAKALPTSPSAEFLEILRAVLED